MSKVQLGHEYLATLRPWNGRGGFSLSEVRAILKRLGDPQDKIPTVHVAGTNGKGSVSAATASILAQCGYRVGMNISPHLFRMNERIVIDGHSCSDEFLGEFAYAIRQAAHQEHVEPSFHEAITALAFLGLYEERVDWSVIEVGLGGRLDASNVISRPAATVIVTIDYDHQAILGNSLGEIAAEKAGIIKAGSPLITGILGKEAEESIGAKAHATTRYRFGREYDARSLTDNRFEYWGKDFIQGKNIAFEFTPDLPGVHQGHNLAVATTVGLAIGCTVDACRRGIEGVFWPGRLERIQTQDVEITMDCAHNPAGIRAFISFLESRNESAIDLTFGVLDTKNWQQMVKMLRPYVKTWRLISPDSDRALPLEQLRDEVGVSGTGVRILAYGSEYERCLRDMLDESKGGRAYITGSMYMVGKVRGMLSLPERPLWERSK